MKSKNRIVYSIDVEDLQNVADQEIDRELTDKGIEFAEMTFSFTSFFLHLLKVCPAQVVKGGALLASCAFHFTLDNLCWTLGEV